MACLEPQEAGTVSCWVLPPRVEGRVPVFPRDRGSRDNSCCQSEGPTGLVRGHQMQVVPTQRVSGWRAQGF